MNIFKENFSSLIICLFELGVGILLLINPVAFTTGIIIAAGIFFISNALFQIIKYFKTDARKAASERYLVKGLIALLAGAFCAFKSDWFIDTFHVLATIYGIVILITGLDKIQSALDMIRTKQKKWFINAFAAIISIVCAGIILKSPFSSTEVLWMFTGTVMIIEAVFDIASLIIITQQSGTSAEK